MSIVTVLHSYFYTLQDAKKQSMTPEDHFICPFPWCYLPWCFFGRTNRPCQMFLRPWREGSIMGPIAGWLREMMSLFSSNVTSVTTLCHRNPFWFLQNTGLEISILFRPPRHQAVFLEVFDFNQEYIWPLGICFNMLCLISRIHDF